MSVTIIDRKINRIFVIDDDTESRNGFGLTVEEMSVETELQNDKVESLEAFISNLGNNDAVVSDHHLRKASNYFPTNGAEFISKCFEKSVPSVLVTKWEIDFYYEIRPYKRNIPVVLKPDEFNPDTLAYALEACIREFKGDISPSRKTWKTLVRVDDADDKDVLVILPSWNINIGVRLKLSEIPAQYHKMIAPDFRFTAEVNIEADQPFELFFNNWQPLKK